MMPIANGMTSPDPNGWQGARNWFNKRAVGQYQPLNPQPTQIMSIGGSAMPDISQYKPMWASQNANQYIAPSSPYRTGTAVIGY